MTKALGVFLQVMFQNPVIVLVSFGYLPRRMVSDGPEV
jgi:hypothetical protein